MNKKQSFNADSTGNSKIAKITFLSGMINSLNEKSSCKERIFIGDEIPAEIQTVFNSEKIAELSGKWGDPGFGSPIQYQRAAVELENGKSCEIEALNLTIMLFHSDDKKIKRLFRFIVKVEIYAKSHE